MFNTAAKRHIAELEAALATAQQSLDAMTLLQRERAVLISMVRKDRYITLAFVRNGQLTSVEFYATTDVNVTALNKTLLEPLPQ